MSIEIAREHLKKYGMDDRIMEFDVSSATVELAAAALGCEEREIAKTLSFMADDRVILVVAAGDCRVDNKKYKAEFAAKAKMIPFDDVERLTGHAAGGVCPFGVREGVEVYLDEALKRFDKVYPACGSANSAIGMTIAELEEASEYIRWVDVCKTVDA